VTSAAPGGSCGRPRLKLWRGEWNASGLRAVGQDDANRAAQPDGARAAGAGVAASDEFQLAQWWPAGDGQQWGDACFSVTLLVPCLATHAVWRQWSAWWRVQCLRAAQPVIVVWEWGVHARARVDARQWDANEHIAAERGV
jgi:hypothetical protein